MSRAVPARNVRLKRAYAEPAADDGVRVPVDPPITLVYAARDEAHNDAVILRDVVMSGRA